MSTGPARQQARQPARPLAQLSARARLINQRERGVPLLLAVDGLLFAGLLTAYLMARAASPEWPRPLHFPSGLMTVAMIMFAVAASFAMRVAVTHAAKKDFAMTQRMLVLAIVGWGTYLLLLAMEWARLYLFEHVQLLSNPWHVPALGISYYVITGMQAAQVLAGCVWLLAAAQHPERWRLFSLEIFIGFVNGLFVVIAFLLIFSSMDLNGF